jgi:phosphoribosylformylglycinamidine cyclo-ligase
LSKLYKNSGVDVVKTDQLIVQALKFIKSSHNKNVLGNKLGFSAEYKINKDITLCSATDGVGTKAILAAELGLYEGIGQDLVGMCSNDLLCNKAKPLFFLDYFACSSVIPKQYTEILKSITRACKKIQCALIGGETAEMPSLYQKNHFDMAGFLVGLKLNQKRLRVKKNDLIIGVKSNGFHSNGYSLIRKIIKDNKINLNKTKIGKKKLSEFLMQPTRLYHELVNESDLKKIKALSHITGGGVISNFKRSLPKNSKFEINLPSLPQEYEFIFDNIKIAEKELMEVFNCGIGLVFVIDKIHYEYFVNKKHFSLIGEIN